MRQVHLSAYGGSSFGACPLFCAIQDRAFSGPGVQFLAAATPTIAYQGDHPHSFYSNCFRKAANASSNASMRSLNACISPTECPRDAVLEPASADGSLTASSS